MKSLFFLLIAVVSTSCSSTIKEDVTKQAKGNLSVGFGTQKVDSGYEVSGHASTNVFGVEPYASFKAGVKYNTSSVQ